MTVDLKVGFQPDKLWDYFLEQEEHQLEEEGRSIPDYFYTKGNGRIFRNGKYCIKRYVQNEDEEDQYQEKYYNKFMYFLMMNGNVCAPIGCQLSKWCKNPSPFLDKKI